jgi:hypothetical protein
LFRRRFNRSTIEPKRASIIEIVTFPIGQGDMFGCYLKPVEGPRIELKPIGRIDIKSSPKVKVIDFNALAMTTRIRFTRAIQLSFYQTIGRAWEVVDADV